MHFVELDQIKIGPGQKLTVISGPCVIEGEEASLYAAEFLKKTCESADVQFIFKSSYDKANRSSVDSFRGPGLEEGLRILEKVKAEFSVPVLTDVHSPQEARTASEVCDVLQIPAFLCRQTDLLVAAGESAKVVNIKKGQFLAPWDMEHALRKVLSTGNQNILLTERGASFGYNNLVSDMRSIPIMQDMGYPVCFDATHSVQLPGGKGSSSGGQREFIPVLAKAAVASGASCLFMEAHPNPSQGFSDKDSMLPFSELPDLLEVLKRVYAAVQN